MNSQSPDSAEEWRQQLAAMKEAVAKLNLPPAGAASDVSDLDDRYGEFDDSDDSYAYYSSTSGATSGDAGQDIWDFISDDELEELGLMERHDDGHPSFAGESSASDAYSQRWLSTRCLALATRSQASADAVPPDVMQAQIMDALQSARPEDELQSHLTDLVGFDDLDFVIELLSHRDAIVAASFADEPDHPDHPDVDGAMVGDQRLLTRAQREEQLRQQDFKHKTAALAAASAREPVYPHVYRAYNAGNSLSVTGRKYALPEGSKMSEKEKYTEYYIPAGRKGTLGPGQSLVKISDLDGLCRGTFQGYTALNRMQSLVYPVAYKTSENMLICAPTGAVGFGTSFISAISELIKL